MPFRYFYCDRCGWLHHRWSNARFCNRRNAEGYLICPGRLVRCDPPADPEPGSPAWLEARAYAAAFARG